MSNVTATLSKFAHFRREAWAIFVLGLPLIINNLILGLTSFIDFAMAGRLGTAELAGVGVGGTIWSFVFLAGLGVMMATIPITAQHHGADEHVQIGEAGRQSIWLALLIGIASFVFLRTLADDVLRLIGVDAELIPLANDYLKMLSWGSVAIFAFLGLRYISEGIGHTKPIMLVAAVGLLVNGGGNYVLMFGNFGAPKMGVAGCGLATALAMWASLLVMLVYMRKRKNIYQALQLFAKFEWPNWQRIKDILKIGLPIGGSVTAEVGLFAAAGLIMGVLGTVDAAAHSVAINYASTMFMVPLALHSALMIRVGQAVGSGRRRDARYSGWVGIAMCTIFMTFSAMGLLVFRNEITSLYVDDAAVRAVAAQLLLMAMIFQIADGVQVGAAGALRGMKDTSVPMYINIFAFWVIGFPTAWYTAISLGYRGTGVWGGLAVGLTVAAILLCWRFYYVSHNVVFDPEQSSVDQVSSG